MRLTRVRIGRVNSRNGIVGKLLCLYRHGYGNIGKRPVAGRAFEVRGNFIDANVYFARKFGGSSLYQIFNGYVAVGNLRNVAAYRGALGCAVVSNGHIFERYARNLLGRYGHLYRSGLGYAVFGISYSNVLSAIFHGERIAPRRAVRRGYSTVVKRDDRGVFAFLIVCGNGKSRGGEGIEREITIFRAAYSYGRQLVMRIDGNRSRNSIIISRVRRGESPVRGIRS